MNIKWEQLDNEEVLLIENDIVIHRLSGLDRLIEIQNFLITTGRTKGRAYRLASAPVFNPEGALLERVRDRFFYSWSVSK